MLMSQVGVGSQGQFVFNADIWYVGEYQARLNASRIRNTMCHVSIVDIPAVIDRYMALY